MLREHRFWHHEKEGGMMSTFQLFLQQLAVICKKEILSIWQDPATRRIVVIPCILMGFLFGYAANYNLENAPYVVLDQSRSGASADLLSRFDGTSLFHRVATVSNANEIAPYIEQEKAVMAISIPQDFQDSLIREKRLPSRSYPTEEIRWSPALLPATQAVS